MSLGGLSALTTELGCWFLLGHMLKLCVIYDLCTEEWGAQILTLGDLHTQVLDVTDVDNWETEAALCEEVDQVKKKKKEV